MQACIPIQRKITVVHGSEDQTTTVHDSSPRFASMMEELGQRFNLAKHTVYSRAVYNQCVDVFGPVDMEGHLGLVRFNFILDCLLKLPRPPSGCRMAGTTCVTSLASSPASRSPRSCTLPLARTSSCCFGS